MSQPATARAALVALRCRAGAPAEPAARGVEALAEAIGGLLGTDPRPIGSFAAIPERYDEDLEVSRGCLLEAGGQVQDALADGARPILVAGDPAIALTTLPTVGEQRPDARILWLSARACFDTADSSPDGGLGGMALAGACGRWDSGLPGAIDGSRLVLCGVGDVSGAERDAIAAAGATVIGTSLETLVFLQNALDGSPVYVHLDAGVLAAEGSSDGLSAEKLFDLLDAVADACEVVGLEVSGLRVPGDVPAVRREAERLAALLVPLLP